MSTRVLLLHGPSDVERKSGVAFNCKWSKGHEKKAAGIPSQAAPAEVQPQRAATLNLAASRQQQQQQQQ